MEGGDSIQLILLSDEVYNYSQCPHPVQAFEYNINCRTLPSASL